eukprot:s1939_g4.t1
MLMQGSGGGIAIEPPFAKKKPLDSGLQFRGVHQAGQFQVPVFHKKAAHCKGISQRMLLMVTLIKFANMKLRFLFETC